MSIFYYFLKRGIIIFVCIILLNNKKNNFYYKKDKILKAILKKFISYIIFTRYINFYKFMQS